MGEGGKCSHSSPEENKAASFPSISAPVSSDKLPAMLRGYLPFYAIALRLQALRSTAELLKDSTWRDISSADDTKSYRDLLDTIKRECAAHGLTHTVKLAARAIERYPPKTHGDLLHELTTLNDSLTGELEEELLFCIPPERKKYFEQTDLFGPEVAASFPSCARDIQKAGNCFALAEEDGCVHHLMLVLERGLHALAAKLTVPYQRTNWQVVIDQIAKQAKSLPRGDERDFYTEVNAQFGFLKDAYRNHSEHAHDDPYDMEKALSILNHVRTFMHALVKGGLSPLCQHE